MSDEQKALKSRHFGGFYVLQLELFLVQILFQVGYQGVAQQQHHGGLADTDGDYR